MDDVLSLIYRHVGLFNNAVEPTRGRYGSRIFEPVRIALLDSGFDPAILHIENDTPRIQDIRSFIPDTDLLDMQDEIGYDAITQAINHAVTEWNVDIITMSFGIREYHEPMKDAIVKVLSQGILMFAAASNDGVNFGRAFPAKYPSIFCIHSTDGNGNLSSFNSTADEKDVNFSLLGQSVPTPIAAGLAASPLSFLRQEEQGLPPGSDLLGPWLKDVHSMDAVLERMAKQRRGQGYDYITPHVLFERNLLREHVYNKIKDIKKDMYD
ncbi:hypothetical protein P154DRAFT_549151 [Amniculicola lignicola CBS 123094]|uniref:Peptidase S8/S53 domain-containing protein n=1 Tax=Amniculicola lignicola CBS 123094 TaxID=1392246 RepID=A0A6A5VX05_9PLEO|nr:hypothetical protein P154DRAFT_549151 [Amniculicola lignicola CBS 123094]